MCESTTTTPHDFREKRKCVHIQERFLLTNAWGRSYESKNLFCVNDLRIELLLGAQCVQTFPLFTISSHTISPIRTSIFMQSKDTGDDDDVKKKPWCWILRDKRDNYTAYVFKCCFSAMNLSGHYSKKLCENANVLIRWTGHWTVFNLPYHQYKGYVMSAHT